MVACAYEGVRQVLAAALEGLVGEVVHAVTSAEVPAGADVVVSGPDLVGDLGDLGPPVVLVTWFPEDERPAPDFVAEILRPGGILAGLPAAVARAATRRP